MSENNNVPVAMPVGEARPEVNFLNAMRGLVASMLADESMQGKAPNASPEDVITTDKLEKILEERLSDLDVEAEHVLGLERFVENEVEGQIDKALSDLDLDTDSIRGLENLVDDRVSNALEDYTLDAEHVDNLEDYLVNFLDSPRFQEALQEQVKKALKGVLSSLLS